MSLILKPAALSESEAPGISAAMAQLVELAQASGQPFTRELLHEMLDGEIDASLAVALDEGFLRAKAGELVDDVKAVGTEIAGWVSSVHEKLEKVDRNCVELVDWLHEQDKSHPGLSLDMGAFFTWMKTSEYFRWRYYYLLEDGVFHEMMKEVKENGYTRIEGMTSVDLTQRRRAAQLLDHAKTIKDLVSIVERFRARAKQFGQALAARKAGVRGAPFQVMLLGYVDLNSSVRKIVRLAK